MSDISAVYRELNFKHPKLVFLNGKTSTGKTTMSKKLKEKYECAIIELDEVVSKLESPAGTNKYLEAYTKRDHLEYIESFVEAVKKRIREELVNQDFVIIEGAIAVNETLQEIIDEWIESFLFIYLDIKDIDVYTQRLVSRFVLSGEDDGNGLPGLFWDKFSPELLQQYYADRRVTPAIEKVVRGYAADSIKVSESRLAMFSSNFDHILKVEI